MRAQAAIAARSAAGLSFLASARPANVDCLGFSITRVSQTVAFLDVNWIDAGRLNGADMQKRVIAAFVVCDETTAAVGIPHFQIPEAILVPLRLHPKLNLFEGHANSISACFDCHH